MVRSIHPAKHTIAALIACIAMPALAQTELTVSDPQAYLMDQAEEIALSRSAAPASISADASVLVLEADGSYRTAVDGTNGWTCFTGRSFVGPAQFKDGKRVWHSGNFDPNIKAPQCFNASSTPSVLKAHQVATWHFMKGGSTDDVDMAIGNALTSGDIQPPELGAMSYMFSPDQVLSPDGGRFHPHIMLYTPFVTQESYGQGNAMQGVPMVTDSGSMFATTVVVVSHWSDGTPATGE